MAKGNIGNLLQHFVALRCAEVLLARWNKPSEPVLYADCFSMAPWEPLTGKSPQGFVAVVESFETRPLPSDLVARSFVAAWKICYAPGRPPSRALQREYPNTALLLRTAFPAQLWQMRLHDHEKRADLEEWASRQSPGTCAVSGDWRESPLIMKNPALPKNPAFIMLDPYQIVRDRDPKDDQFGYLEERRIRYLFGRSALDLISRPAQEGAAPALATLFSYSDSHREDTNRLVSELFAPAGWNVEHVSSGPWNTRGNPKTYHLGWVVSCGLPTPLLGHSLQQTWDDWLG